MQRPTRPEAGGRPPEDDSTAGLGYVIVTPESEAQFDDALDALGALGVWYEVVRPGTSELGDFNPELVRRMYDKDGTEHAAITQRALDRYVAKNYPPEKYRGKKAYSPLFREQSPYDVKTAYRFATGFDEDGFPVYALRAEQFEPLLDELRRNYRQQGTTGIRYLGSTGLTFLEENILPHIWVDQAQDTA